jgi:acyl-CoA synthetase (AMP-forming)/AMP-acid ligase II
MANRASPREPGTSAGTAGREATPVLYQSLAQLAERQPDAVAVRYRGRGELDYSSLLATLNHTKNVLRGLGVGSHDRVSIVMPNGPEMALLLLGVMGCAACAPLNPRYTVREFEFYLADLKARAVIVGAGFRSAVRDAARNLGVQLVEGSAADLARIGGIQLAPATAPATAPTALPQESLPEDVALVLHTSGTTSRPKLVALTQGNLCASARNIAATLRLTRQDSCLNIMPLFHIHGIVAGLLSPILSGGSVICSPGLSDDPFFLAQFPSWLREMQPSWYTAVPSMHQAILGCAERDPDAVARSRLRFIRSSSAPLPPQVMAALEQTFKAPVIEAYGMTEASHQMASNPLPPAPRKPKSVGIPAGCRMAVMDPQGRALKNGEKGEIVIQGANVMSAYENNPAANREAFFGEWFRTGDEGVFDDDGYLFITGRLKELVNRAGEKISPREIDEVLLEHPAVLQAVTFAFPHATLGEVPAAAVVLRQGQSVERQALQEFIATKLAPFKVPNPIVFVDDIPKGPTGKLQRIGLAERLRTEGKL